MSIYEALHSRECQVVDILTENPDLHDKDIATRIGIATFTTKIYLGRAMRRYRVKTRTGLVAARLKEMHDSVNV